MGMKRRAAMTTMLAVASGAARAEGTVRTIIETALGTIVVTVDPAKAPITVANYLAYVDRGLLDGGSFYRIVTPANQTAPNVPKIEVVQWGMHLDSGKQPPLPQIAHETTAMTGLRHLNGTVSMARLAPGTAASEFFICVGDQPELDFGGKRNPDGQGFAAFGQVSEGMDVVRKIYAKGEDATQYIAQPVAIVRVRRG